MPMKLARRLSPNAIVISGDMELYSRKSRQVTEVIADKAPLFEKSSIDEFYIDASGMDKFFGTWKWAGELRQKIMKETGLPISLGLSANKLVSKVATGEAKPSGQLQIFKGTEKKFLSPLSVSKIPMVGTKTREFLVHMGVRKVKTLQQIPREMLEQILGKTGRSLWKRARGIDDSPVVPYSERKSISTERTFGEDTIDVKGLRATLMGMTEKLAFGIRKENKLTACITVKIRYSNFDTVTKQARIPYTASDHQLAEKALELFEGLYDRRLRIRLIGVRFSDLITGGYQIRLFEDTEKHISLYEAVDKMKFRYGAGAVTRACTVGALGRMGNYQFSPFTGQPDRTAPLSG